MNDTKTVFGFSNQTNKVRIASDQILELNDPQEVDETLLCDERFLRVETPKLSHYHASIDAIPVLSFEDEFRYARMVQSVKLFSDDDVSGLAQEAKRNAGIAKQVLIEHNLRLVRSIARKQESRGVLLDDLIQEGTIGLIEAIDKYDPEFGFRLSTYAFQTIQQKIKRCIQDQGKDLRIPNSVQDKIAKIKGVQSFLLQLLEREPSDLEIALCIKFGKDKTQALINAGETLFALSCDSDFGEYDPDIIKDLLSIIRPIVRIDVPISEEDDREWVETLAMPQSESLNPIDRGYLRNLLRKLMTILDEREALVIAYRYGLDGREKISYEDLGKKLGLTRERARQIEKEALETLRTTPDSSQLLAFIS